MSANYTKAMKGLRFSVAPIATWSKGSGPNQTLLSKATGLFYENEGKQFLITNRHVVIDEKNYYYADYLNIVVHTDQEDLKQVRTIKIPLYGNDRSSLWLEHPSLKADVDVIAIDIKDHLTADDMIFFWSKDYFLPSNRRLSLGNEAVILGYPLGFYDTIHYLPIAKNGTVASEYGVYFNGKPYFLIDANLYPGNSGGPVIRPPARFFVMGVGKEIFLLGIYSGDYQVNGIKLGLGVVWYSKIIQEIV